LFVFALATLLTLGGSLWFALRDLHRDATIGSLTELAVPYATAVRTRVPEGALRPGGAGGRNLIDRLRGLEEDDFEVAEFREAFREEVADSNVAIVFTIGQSSIILNPEEGGATALTDVPELEGDLVRGQVATGTTRIEGIGEVLYATTSIIGPNRQPGADPNRTTAPYLMLARPDDSATRATADLVRALTAAALILVVIGLPLAIGLSRSVTSPLRKLSAATSDVAQGKVPEPLPVSGPMEVAEASAAFNAMASEVAATREAQRQLLADIRHDLRTPLTVIGGFSQALKDGTASGDTAVRAADAISDETDRLGRMLDDLDHLTVPGVASPPLRLESIDALEAAQSAVDRFAAEALGNEQVLRVADGAVQASLLADRDALDRILGNIIANALKHAPSPDGQVTLEVNTAERRVTVAVRDDGPGIPQAALPHVFDRFYRADPSRTGHGSGLGLAIVRDLAEALGGEAFAENVEGTGARVGVTLPASGTTSIPGTA
jgi:signal transduction histidine kinase